MDSKKPAADVQWQTFAVSKSDREKTKGHPPAVIWLTGIPASGKTTIARELEKRLHDRGAHAYVLDGDNVRHGLNRDLGFSKESRKENIRRIAEVAKLFCDAGIITICSFVSPYREDRELARNLVEESEFIEVFVSCPVEVCIQRDPKSMYGKAIAGKMKAFTGIDDPYEVPDLPEITIETDKMTLTGSVEKIIGYLHDKGFFETLKHNCYAYTTGK
jgi:adenylylsulfate kinase